MAEEMLFWRSWFFPTESSSSEENEGNVSRFLFSSSSKRLGLEQLPRARPPLPSLSPNGGGGGGGGGAGDSGRSPPDLQGEFSPLSGSIPGEMSKPGGLFPVLRKSKNEATKPALDSESFSSLCKQYKKRLSHSNTSPKAVKSTTNKKINLNQNEFNSASFNFLAFFVQHSKDIILTLSSSPSSSTPSLIIWLFGLFLS